MCEFRKIAEQFHRFARLFYKSLFLVCLLPDAKRKEFINVSVQKKEIGQLDMEFHQQLLEEHFRLAEGSGGKIDENLKTILSERYGPLKSQVLNRNNLNLLIRCQVNRNNPILKAELVDEILWRILQKVSGTWSYTVRQTAHSVHCYRLILEQNNIFIVKNDEQVVEFKPPSFL
jgi:hypothetical protein